MDGARVLALAKPKEDFVESCKVRAHIFTIKKDLSNPSSGCPLGHAEPLCLTRPPPLVALHDYVLKYTTTTADGFLLNNELTEEPFSNWTRAW